MEGALFEVFIDECQEFLPDVGGNGGVKWWIVPVDFPSFVVFLVFFRLGFLAECQLVFVAAVVECFLVLVFGDVEIGLTTGYTVESFVDTQGHLFDHIGSLSSMKNCNEYFVVHSFNCFSLRFNHLFTPVPFSFTSSCYHDVNDLIFVH